MIEKYVGATPDPVAARTKVEGACPDKRLAHPRELA